MFKFTEKQEAWLQALESGKYKQGNGALHTIKDEFCCLGIACVINGLQATARINDVYEYRYGEEASYCLLPIAFANKLGLHTRNGSFKKPFKIGINTYFSLSCMNDSGDFTFAEIAEYVRTNAANVFVDWSLAGSNLT